jgi:hypothetical protein
VCLAAFLFLEMERSQASNIKAKRENKTCPQRSPAESPGYIAITKLHGYTHVL